MQVHVSLVIGGLSPGQTRVTVSPDPAVIRQDLVEFYNDAVADGGLDDEAPTLDPDTNIGAVVGAIDNWIGRHVLLLETEVIQ